MSTSGLPEEAYAVALAMEPDVGPSTLRRLLDGKRPSEAWAWAGPTGTPARAEPTVTARSRPAGSAT